MKTPWLTFNRLLAGVLGALIAMLIAATAMADCGKLPPAQPPISAPQP